MLEEDDKRLRSEADGSAHVLERNCNKIPLKKVAAREGELPLVGGEDLLGSYDTYNGHGTTQYDAERE